MDMDWELVILLGLVIALFAFGAFSGGFTRTGPLATPPNPNAEFGVEYEKKSYLDIFRPSRAPSPTPRLTPPPTPPPSPTPSPDLDALLKKYVSVSVRNARSRNENQEYIDIIYSRNAPKDAPDTIVLSDWTIGNARGESFLLGSATNLPHLSSIQNQDKLLLAKGGVIHVITGKSPMGINFRANTCASYFSQNYQFTPSISSYSCPPPSKEPGQDGFSDTCYLFMKQQSSCKIPKTLPLNLDNQCREYITRTISYNGCIENHRYDTDFYTNDWWVYLNRPTPLWSEIRDTITLKNNRGIVIATVSYQ